MTHPVHTVMRHVVEICEVLIHWRRERWTPSERGKEIGGGEQAEEKAEEGEGEKEEEEEEIVSERRGGEKGGDIHTKRFLSGSGSGGREGCGGRVRCGRTNICNRGWFFLEVVSSGRLSLHV